jgi:hypothetical protein
VIGRFRLAQGSAPSMVSFSLRDICQQAFLHNSTMATTAETKKNILFFHPDLGIGGAERLIIDAAVGLQNRGHKVIIFTSHCDPKHCFDEARDGILI